MIDLDRLAAIVARRTAITEETLDILYDSFSVPTATALLFVQLVVDHDWLLAEAALRQPVVSTGYAEYRLAGYDDREREGE